MSVIYFDVFFLARSGARVLQELASQSIVPLMATPAWPGRIYMNVILEQTPSQSDMCQLSGSQPFLILIRTVMGSVAMIMLSQFGGFLFDHSNAYLIASSFLWILM